MRVLYAALEKRGALQYELLVAHARDIQLIYGGDKKNDTLDAEKLARLAQFDRKLLHPVKLMNEERQRDFAILKVRDLLVRQKTQIVNSIRGILRSFGESDEEFTVANMKSAGEKLNPELKEIFLPLLQQLNFLELNIKTYDRTIKKLCKKYKAREILRQIPGIGPEISLAFILIVGDPRRFPNAAHACAYFGLVPTQDQSGDVDKQLSITKHGNKLMRRLLVQGAQYIMGPFAEESDLRHFGMKIASRGGKTAKKKIRWFSVNTKAHMCLAFCPIHGYFRGKARLKKTDEGKYYVVKTLKKISQEEAEHIREKRDALRKKRRQKRHHEK